ncbi:ribbon-helix-helix domain-containing protein [Natrinema thermotolerans]|uniref:ribbon-helix-helix domain-containing protein n=1 Tax=Natrinema thermotolerans TaxID=121872 RepID=UPI000678FC96|nr:ribbon-helix-helix domain-containing protein [Natrinema thermotolerans]QCC57237.1 hypothetical protein DVR14_00760 [Natrinema thermotolerans]
MSSNAGSTTPTERITIRLAETRVAALETIVDEGAYPNRSEAIRDGIDTVIDAHDAPAPDAPAVHGETGWDTDMDGRSKRTAVAQPIERLRERPRAGGEIDTRFSVTQRQLVSRLKPASAGGQVSRGRAATVYYLYGDERRAVRRFIEENTEYVRSCLEADYNPLRANWDEVLYSLLVQEWVAFTDGEEK